jgi:hypothetical protein
LEEFLAAPDTGTFELSAPFFLIHGRIESQGSHARLLDDRKVNASSRRGNNILEQTGGMLRAVSIDRERRPAAGALKQEDHRLRLVIVGHEDADPPGRPRNGVLRPITGGRSRHRGERRI